MAQSLDALSRTWSDAGTTFTAIKYDITDSGSAAGSLLMDLQVGGASRFSVKKDGSVLTPLTWSLAPATQGNGEINILARSDSNTTGLNISHPGQSLGFFINSTVSRYRFNVSALSMQSTIALRWATGTDHNVFDLALARDAANTLAQRNGANAQTFRIYNTFTDASNHERGKIEWSSNVLRIGTEKAGSGTARALELQTDGTTRLTISASGTTLDLAATQINMGLGTRLTSIVNGTFGLTTSANVAGQFVFGNNAGAVRLKPSSTTLQVRLGDDSAFTNIQGKITTETAYAATAPTPTGYLVLYDSTGTAYKVPAEAL
jgi:hypothetical protein